MTTGDEPASDEFQGPLCRAGGCGPRIGGVSLVQLLLIAIFLLFAWTAANGQLLQQNPEHTQRIDVIEHLGDTVDLTLPVIDSAGDTVTLASQFADELPVVLVFHYSDCPMLCSLVLNGVSAVTNASDLVPGKDYRILTVSVNPAEGPDRAKASEERFNAELPDNRVGEPWRFFTATQATLDSLTTQVGFQYYYDEKREEFMHPAVIHVLDHEGHITRYLYGIEFKPRDFRLAIVEGARGLVGSTVDRILLYCMHYDPDAEGYVVIAGQVMKLGGAVTLVIFGTVLGGFWLKERRRRPSQA